MHPLHHAHVLPYQCKLQLTRYFQHIKGNENIAHSPNLMHVVVWLNCKSVVYHDVRMFSVRTTPCTALSTALQFVAFDKGHLYVTRGTIQSHQSQTRDKMRECIDLQ